MGHFLTRRPPSNMATTIPRGFSGAVDVEDAARNNPTPLALVSLCLRVKDSAGCAVFSMREKKGVCDLTRHPADVPWMCFILLSASL